MCSFKTLTAFFVLAAAMIWAITEVETEKCDRRAARLQLTGEFVPLAGCFIHTPDGATVPAHVAESAEARFRQQP